MIPSIAVIPTLFVLMTSQDYSSLHSLTQLDAREVSNDRLYAEETKERLLWAERCVPYQSGGIVWAFHALIKFMKKGEKEGRSQFAFPTFGYRIELGKFDAVYSDQDPEGLAWVAPKDRNAPCKIPDGWYIRGIVFE